MRLILIVFVVFYISSFAQNKQPAIKRDKYIDEVLFPTTHFQSNIDSLLKLGYRAFIIDSVSNLKNTDIESINLFLKNHPDEFIAFLQEGNNHFNGDYLFSYFLKRIINFDLQFLPKCDTLLKQKKQILFISNKIEELKLPSEDYLTYVKIGKFFPLKKNNIYYKFKPTNLFTVFSFEKDHIVERPDSAFVNSTHKEAALNYFKQTGKFPNFVLTNNPTDVQFIQSQLPFYFKLSFVNQSGYALDAVKFKNIDHSISSGITHLYIDRIKVDSLNIFRENLEVVPIKKGYRFIPEIFTFNYNNYNQFKQIKAQRIDIRKDLVFYMPLKKGKLYHDSYPVMLFETTIDFIKNSERKTVSSFDGKKNSLYFGSQNLINNEKSFSIALWINPHSIDGNYPFFSKPGSYCFKIREEVLCFTIVDIVDIKSEYSLIKKNTWQHVALVFEKGGYIKYFVNSILTDIIPAVDIKSTEASYIIGADQWDEYFDGEISDLLFWSRPIGSDEISDLFKNGITIKENSLINKIRLPLVGLIFVSIALTGSVFWRKKRKQKLFLNIQSEFIVPGEKANYIQCFGHFSIFDKDGINVSEKLSSKKRSFLLVLLYYSINDYGISPQKLADLFWPGYNPQRAKNVRGTYMQEIRSVISDKLLKISYKNKKWKITLNQNLFCDLSVVIEYKNLIKKMLHEGIIREEVIDPYVEIISTGRFAEELHSEYTDSIKQKLNDQILGTLEDILNLNIQSSNFGLVLKICDAIYIQDPIHELAIKTKIEVLLLMGKEHLAHKCFNKFSIDWNKFYGEPLYLSFNKFLENT